MLIKNQLGDYEADTMIQVAQATDDFEIRFKDDGSVVTVSNAEHQASSLENESQKHTR